MEHPSLPPFPNEVLTSALRCLGAHRLREEALKVGASCFEKPDPFCPAPHLSICLSCPSLSPPHQKHNAPLSRLSPIVGQQGPLSLSSG